MDRDDSALMGRGKARMLLAGNANNSNFFCHDHAVPLPAAIGVDICSCQPHADQADREKVEDNSAQADKHRVYGHKSRQSYSKPCKSMGSFTAARSRWVLPIIFFHCTLIN